MKIKTFIQHLAFWLMCTTTVANAQVKEISGKVTAKTGDDIIGATVIVEGTNLGTSTGSDGTYHIQNVPNNAQLTFSYIGYTSQTVDVKGRTKIDIALVEDTGSIDEVVVIGYGTAKKSDLTGSVSRVTAESFKSVPTTQIADALAGKVAGMAFTQSGGASGGGTMLIRGKSTQLAVANPLIVLDGVVYNGSVGDINPSDIETIDVMKDASSAAVYGSRAAAGVVFITTKRGTSGAPKINFTTSLGLSAAANLNKTYDRDGYLNYREDFMYEYDQTRDAGYFSNPSSLSGSELQSWLAMNPTASSDAELEWLKRLQLTDGEIEGYQSGMNTDWYDMAYRTGIHQAYDFNVSGGNQYSTYYLSMGYTDNEGIILGDDYDAFRAKLNLSIQATDFLKLGAYLTYSNKQSTSSVINTTNLKLMSPLVDSFNDDGSLDFQPGEMYASNPFITYYYQDSLYQNTNLFSIFTADLTLPFGITYQLSFQPRFVYSQTYIFNNTSTSAASGSRKDSTKYAYMIDNLFKWNKEIGDLFRWENINNQLNNETILATVDRYEDEMSRSWGCYKLRSFSPQLTHVSVVDSEGKVAVIGTGAGIDTIMIGNGDARPVEYMIKDIWNIHGETWDNTSDYRRADANWIDEHELIVNNPSSVDFGKPIQKEWFGNGATYQYYFGYPYYKTYYPMQDEARTAALKGYGGCGDSYLYRLAEAYLIRAEAYYWLDQIGNALSDVNVIRERANAALATASDITIDYIMDERARELFSEEMRTCEISRVALIMAKEGKEGYSMESLGTSNWYYDRMTKVNNQYRDQVVYLGETYKVSPHNVLMPVPAEAITANTLGRINQNYGYDGYGQNVPALTEPLSDPVE
ncbi:MAG: RagB/SusD family nutrient uptake outer membrane protein [Rikenellaceae bacterium]